MIKSITIVGSGRWAKQYIVTLLENKLTNFGENNISFQSSPSLLVQYEVIVWDRLILEQTLITLNAQKELSEVELKSNADLFLILNEPYLPPYKNPPSNKTLFLMLSVVSFILSVTITLIIDEKSKKEIQLWKLLFFAVDKGLELKN